MEAGRQTTVSSFVPLDKRFLSSVVTANCSVTFSGDGPLADPEISHVF